MLRLKEIAVMMDNCHPRTAKRWWKKLGVPPTVGGHGAHRWSRDDAQKLYARWALWRRHKDSTPEFLRDEYEGVFSPLLLAKMLERAERRSGRKIPRRKAVVESPGGRPTVSTCAICSKNPRLSASAAHDGRFQIGESNRRILRGQNYFLARSSEVEPHTN